MSEIMVIREVRLKPYLRGPRFRLFLLDDHGKLGYRLEQRDGKKVKTIFEGWDFRPSPLDGIDSNETVKELMGFLTVRPGDTDPQYFDRQEYTREQMNFAVQHGEAVSIEVLSRFGESKNERDL